MSKAYARLGSPLRLGAPLVLLAFSAIFALSQTTMATANANPHTQSDPAAIDAMRKVLSQSGGHAWSSVRSAEETFSVQTSADAPSRIMRMLDDWSQDSTRYRRGLQGQTHVPEDHNGATAFTTHAKGSELSVPEFDQARVLVARLPAVAAEVMLRRREYVLKIVSTQSCAASDVCVDVYRTQSLTGHLPPEQEWKISLKTGLPRTIRYQTNHIGSANLPTWREVYFLQYDTRNGLTVPSSIAMVWNGRSETWTLNSIKTDVGFDTARFDQEVAQ